MASTPQEVVDRWMTEAGREDPHFLTRSNNSLFVSKEGILYYDASQRGRWMNGRPQRNIHLAQFIGSRYGGGFVYLNGDGLDDRNAMTWQTRIRERCQASFGILRCAIIPISALRAAEIEIASIKPIEITEDRNEVVPVWLPELDAIGVQGGPTLGARTVTLRQLEDLHFGSRQEIGSHPPERIRSGGHPNGELEARINGRRVLVQFDYTVDTDVCSRIRMYLWAQPENGVPSWQSLDQEAHPVEGKRMWVWNQNVHRLGAVVFSARDTYDQVRTRWLSAFDTHEPDPLYFLAQLPRLGKIKNYADAVNALAPIQVHRAWAEHIPVYRQGDIFAIQTSFTDEQVYEDATSVVRRDIALQDIAGLHRRGNLPAPGRERDVKEKVPCPHCGGHTMEVFCGPEARRALLVHGTTHTADEVVVKPGGVTFIRGGMYHNPELETAGRMPEHQPVLLEGNTWFICIRNTVPRQKQRANGNGRGVLRLAPWPGANQRDQMWYTDPALPSISLPPTGYIFAEYRVPDTSVDIWLARTGHVRRPETSTGGRTNITTRNGQRHILAEAPRRRTRQRRSPRASEVATAQLPVFAAHRGGDFYCYPDLPTRMQPPPGYVFSEFRRPLPNEIWLSDNGTVLRGRGSPGGHHGGRRHILVPV